MLNNHPPQTGFAARSGAQWAAFGIEFRCLLDLGSSWCWSRGLFKAGKEQERQKGQPRPWSDRDHHHGPWWTPQSSHGSLPLLGWPCFVGSRHYGLPMANPTVRDDPVFSYVCENVPCLCASSFCTRQSIRIKVPFGNFSDLYI